MSDFTDKLQPILEENPTAGGLLLVMELQAQQREGDNKIMRDLYEIQERRNAELESQLRYWRPLGLRFLQIQDALTFTEPLE